METYRIVADKLRLISFLDRMLPPLLEGECYYASLFARKKYHPSADSDKTCLKRIVATDKWWLFHKIAQLEVPTGTYTNKKGEAIHQDALALYLHLNPRDFKKAQVAMLTKLADLIGKQQTSNPIDLALTEVHKAKARSTWVDFDFDTTIPFMSLQSEINACFKVEHAYHVLKTRGGFHLLVNPTHAGEGTWYKQLQNLSVTCDVAGDNMIPVPGTFQGGFEPHLLELS
jgi:hypothetical protein